MAGDGGDAIKVGVIVEDDKALSFSGGCDQEAGDFPASLVLRGQESLHLFGAAHVVAGRLDEVEQLQRSGESVPFGSAAR